MVKRVFFGIKYIVQNKGVAVSKWNYFCIFTFIDYCKRIRVGHESIMNTKRIICEMMYKVFPTSKDGTESRVAIVVLMINALSK